MNKNFLVRWVFDVPAIIAFGFSQRTFLDFAKQFSNFKKSQINYSQNIFKNYNPKSQIFLIGPRSNTCYGAKQHQKQNLVFEIWNSEFVKPCSELIKLKLNELSLPFL